MMQIQRIVPSILTNTRQSLKTNNVFRYYVKAYATRALPKHETIASDSSKLLAIDDSIKKPIVTEIKDAKLVFDNAWKNIEDCYGRENIRLPREIIFLMGAPGSGKGTHTPSILRTRGITNPPISVSQLLQTPECKELMTRGQMVPDSAVIEQLLHAMLNCDPSVGVLVDGFPRTDIQAEILQLLHDRMLELRKDFWHQRDQYPRSVFRICVLYIDEETSVIRQLQRGRAIRERNKQIRISGQGNVIDERITDNDANLSQERYSIYQQNYASLLKLQNSFPFHLINATGTVKQVLQTILKEFEYQSSLELDSDTFDTVSRIPVASDISKRARQDLICRLEHYQDTDPNMLHMAIRFIEETIMPKVLRHSICGHANILSEDSMLSTDRFSAMVMDVLSERGYHVSIDHRAEHIPIQIDLKTGKIKSRANIVYSIHVEFPKHHIRPLEQKFT